MARNATADENWVETQAEDLPTAGQHEEPQQEEPDEELRADFRKEFARYQHSDLQGRPRVKCHGRRIDPALIKQVDSTTSTSASTKPSGRILKRSDVPWKRSTSVDSTKSGKHRSLFRYYFGSPLKWTKISLRDLDRATQAILRKHRGGTSVERLYLKSRSGGQGLQASHRPTRKR